MTDELHPFPAPRADRIASPAAGEPGPRIVAPPVAELADGADPRRAIEALAERARAAEAGEQRLLEILESITDGFYVLDDEGRFTYVNARVEALTGKPRSEILGHVAWELFDLAPDSLAVRMYRQARETGRGNVYETYIGRIDRWVEIRSYPGPSSYSAYVRDVTEQRRQHELLRKSEERWRLVGVATTDLMYDWDVASGGLFFNDSLRTAFGHESFDARIEWWEQHIHPDDRAAVGADLQRAMDGDAGTWEFEYRFRRGDGSWATVLDRGCFVRDESGRVVRMVGAMQDVTERRRVEEQLLQSQKMDVMGQLAAGVAHDFNNLLTVMFGYLQLADGNLDPDHPAAHDLAEVQRAAEQAAALTRHLLVFSRKQVARPRVVDLGEIVATASGLLARLMGTEHQLRTRGTAGLWMVHIDPLHAELALMNLVVNARDAMPRGGTVEIDAANVTLEEPLARALPSPLAPGEYVRVVVRDQGVGMDADTLAHIWEPFFTTKSLGRGTGLGLPTVQGLVARAGGGVDVTSERGKGTSFTIYLPRARDEADAGARSSVAARGSERVLVVENEAAVRMSIRRTLEQHGYTVMAARDAAEAERLARAAADPVDVVIAEADIGSSPGSTTRSLGTVLAAIGPTVPLVLLAGVTMSAELPPEAMGRRVRLVQKPFTSHVLVHALRGVLDEP